MSGLACAGGNTDPLSRTILRDLQPSDEAKDFGVWTTRLVWPRSISCLLFVMQGKLSTDTICDFR